MSSSNMKKYIKSGGVKTVDSLATDSLHKLNLSPSDKYLIYIDPELIQETKLNQKKKRKEKVYSMNS